MTQYNEHEYVTNKLSHYSVNEKCSFAGNIKWVQNIIHQSKICCGFTELI